MPIAPEFLHLVHPGEMTAFLYGRASVDPKRKGRSVNSQLTEGRDLCADYNWPIVAEFRDVDRSASRYAKKSRDDFEAMLDGIDAGKCRIVVAFEASRYYRDLEAYIRLRNACAANGVLLCYNGTIYDLSKREDRKATAMDALQAEDEAEGIRERNLRTMRHNAKKGRPHGRLLWGYARRYDPDTGDLIEQYPHPERAEIVREIFERAAAGESQYAIMQSLRERGERVPGIKWELHHIANMLRNRSYVGRRTHQGADVGAATWPALVDDVTWQTVQRIVHDPARRTTRDHSVKHLLSGIARCGECDGVSHLRVLKNRTYLAYHCSQYFHTTMREDKLDAYVEEAVIDWLKSKAALAAFQSSEDEANAEKARARRDRLQRQLDEARDKATRFHEDGTPELSVESLAALETALMPQIKKAETEAEVVSAPPLLRGILGRPDMEQIWDDLTFSQKRMVLRAVVNIRLYKARSRGVRKIEPGRIRLVWYGQPEFVSPYRKGVARSMQHLPEPEKE